MTNFLSFGLKAYEGLEIQEIGRSSAFKGKDKCQENPSKEPDSSSTEPWCAPADRFQEHHRDCKEFLELLIYDRIRFSKFMTVLQHVMKLKRTNEANKITLKLAMDVHMK
jgi:hypothetical protein